MSHLLIPTYEGDIRIVSILLDLQADADGCIEGIEVRILGIGYAESGGCIDAVLNADDRGVDLSLHSEIIVPVDDQDQCPLHAVRIFTFIDKLCE